MKAFARDEAGDAQRYYRERLERFGPDDARALGMTREAQRKRFAALCDLGDFDRRRLLDAGCGVGDLLGFLVERGARPFYSGLDLCAEMVQGCRRRFQGRPELSCHFEQGAILDHQPAAPYEYVVASGVFGHSSPLQGGEVEPSLERMFSWCTVGLAVNFLSVRAPRRDPGQLYLEPAAMLELALRMTPSVRIRHDYLPNDFTLYLYRQPPDGRRRHAAARGLASGPSHRRNPGPDPRPIETQEDDPAADGAPVHGEER